MLITVDSEKSFCHTGKDFFFSMEYCFIFLRNHSCLNLQRTIKANFAILWTTDHCEKDGLFGLFWDNYVSDSCEPSRDSASTSSALDLFISAAKTQQPPSSSKWMLLGLGNCMDDNNASMPNFYSDGVNETLCRTTANEDTGAVAYDYQSKCDGSGFCRIRTLSDQTHTPPGFQYGDGSARAVTRTNKMVLTNCYLKIINLFN